jgi:hypothetical protein
MNIRYIKGRRLEYKVKKELEKNGYIVIRSAGSHSPFDLVALKQTTFEESETSIVLTFSVNFLQLKYNITSTQAEGLLRKTMTLLFGPYYEDYFGIVKNVLYPIGGNLRSIAAIHNRKGAGFSYWINFGVLYTEPKRKYKKSKK